MSLCIRFTLEAKSDLERLYGFLAEQEIAEGALDVIDRAWTVLEELPFSCRKADNLNPFVSAGYVALFEIENQQTVTVLAARHQREDDYRWFGDSELWILVPYCLHQRPQE